MAKKSKKKTEKLTISKDIVMNAEKPRYNSYALVNGGFHGNKKYNRNNNKKATRKAIAEY